jgi:hypothetical protein
MLKQAKIKKHNKIYRTTEFHGVNHGVNLSEK